MATFWSWQLVLAALLNAIVQSVMIASYAARLAGARSGRVGTAMSLYNVFVTASRFASLLYTPMLGALSDFAGRNGGDGLFLLQLRSIVLSGMAGTIVGTLAIPVFVALYLRGIRSFERRGNVVTALIRLLRPKTAYSVLREARGALQHRVFRFSLTNVPKEVIILNTFVSAIYSIGIVSAAYASVLNPATARTALLSSGLVNGVAVIAYNIVVDPASAFMTDQAVRGERSIDDVRSLVTYLSLSSILGFAVSQVLLVPAAVVIGYAAHLVTAR
jgi:hypothetical protein